jgi:hypothetical protein
LPPARVDDAAHGRGQIGMLGLGPPLVGGRVIQTALGVDAIVRKRGPGIPDNAGAVVELLGTEWATPERAIALGAADFPRKHGIALTLFAGESCENRRR